jgi:hypothetical protein
MPTKSEMIDFERNIEILVKRHKIDHIDAIVMYCKEQNLEIEVAATMVNRNLKQKLAMDAQNLHLLPKTRKLPI